MKEQGDQWCLHTWLASSYSVPPQFFLACSLSIAISSLLQQVPTQSSDPATILLYLKYTDTDQNFSSNLR